MTDATELLAQLRDVQTPPAPAQAPVWPALLALVLLLSAMVVLFFIWHRRRLRGLNWYRHRLTTIRKDASSDQITACAALLRSYAMGCRDAADHNDRASQRDIAHLTGAAWLQHLDALFDTTYFSTGDGRVLGESLYQPAHAAANGDHRTSLIDAIDGLLRRQKRWRYRDRWHRLQQQVSTMPAHPPTFGQRFDAI